MESTNVETMLVDPAILLGDDNSRFNLKQSRIDSLAESFETEGVMVALEVEELDAPVSGALYRITHGHYRQAAALKVKEKNPSFQVPIIVKPIGDPVARLKRQLAENMERENQSPMDQAYAIKRLTDAGVPKMEIRNIFKRPAGVGRKGYRVQAASNSYINMMLSFLEFPKAIQNKIHNGDIGVLTAYELSKKPRDKWEAILAEAEAEREKQAEQEQKDEEKYIAAQKKVDEATEKAKAVETELEKAKETLAKAQEDAKLKVVKAGEAYTASKAVDPKEKEAKAKAEAEFKAAEEESKAADKAVAEASKAVEKLEGKAKTAAETADERRKRLVEARKAASKPANKPKGPSARDVAKAASAQGVDNNHVALNATEMRKCIEEWALPGSFPKVSAMAQVIDRVFKGILTPAQGYSELAFSVTKETKDKPKHMKG